MALFAYLFGAPLVADTVNFEVGPDQIDPALFGLAAYTDSVAPVGRVSRASAIQVPAIKRARDLVCGTLGGVPMQLVGPGFDEQPSPLLDQPERNVPRSVSLTRLYEDLLFEGVAWWRIRENDYRGYPVKVERVAPDRVSISDSRAYVDGRPVSDESLIRFDSPNDPLLVAGGRAIRTLLRLEAAAANYAEDPMPQGYFRPAEDADPADDDDVRQILTAWKTARQQRATGYVPAALRYETVSFSPEQLQMNAARQHAVLEIARLTGIDAEDLSVSTTSRTYQNGQDRRFERINDVLGPYSLAVTDRLRMGDVTARGYTVRADFSAFLRADDATRFANYAAARALGLLTLDQIAAREGLPTPDAQPARPALTAVPNQEASA